MTAREIGNDLVTGMRWMARLVGLFACGLFALFFVESGAQVLSALSWSDLRGMPLFLALTVAIAGIIVAWRREAIGGVMSLVGGLMMLALVYLASGSGMTFTAFLLALPLLFAGALYLACSIGARLAMLVSGRETQACKSGQRALLNAA